MASRWMAEKLLKQKKHRQKMRKAYMAHRKHSYDPHSPVALSARGGRKIDLAAPVPPTKIPNTIPAYTVEVNPKIDPKEILLRSWQDLRLQGYTTFHRVVLIDTNAYKLDLYFSGMDFIFIEEDIYQKKRSRSGVYKGRDSAYRAYKRNKILWEATEPISST